MALAGGVVLIGGILMAWKPNKLEIVVAVWMLQVLVDSSVVIHSAKVLSLEVAKESAEWAR
jgi:hypothetical protein